MKRTMLVAVAAVIIIIAMVDGAFAAGTLTPTVVVNAAVKSVCTQQSNGNFAVNDIQIDPSAGAQIFTPSTDEVLKCTKNASVLIEAQTNNGSGTLTACDQTTGVGGNLTGTGGKTIAYTLSCSNADGTGHITGSGFGSTNPLGLRVNISALAAASADAGGNNYQDNVTLTISF